MSPNLREIFIKIKQSKSERLKFFSKIRHSARVENTLVRFARAGKDEVLAAVVGIGAQRKTICLPSGEKLGGG